MKLITQVATGVKWVAAILPVCSSSNTNLWGGGVGGDFTSCFSIISTVGWVLFCFFTLSLNYFATSFLRLSFLSGFVHHCKYLRSHFTSFERAAIWPPHLRASCETQGDTEEWWHYQEDVHIPQWHQRWEGEWLHQTQRSLGEHNDPVKNLSWLWNLF